MPHVRFTIRGLMLMVAIVALILTSIPRAAEALYESDLRQFLSARFGLFMVLVSFAIVLSVDVASREALRPHPRGTGRSIPRQAYHALAMILIIVVAIGSTMVGSGLRSHWDSSLDQLGDYRSALGRHQSHQETCSTYVKQLKGGRDRDLQLLRDAQKKGDDRGAELLRVRIDLREKAIERFLRKRDEEGEEVDQYQRKLHDFWREIIFR